MPEEEGGSSHGRSEEGGGVRSKSEEGGGAQGRLEEEEVRRREAVQRGR